jgi:hypothetical protein
MVRIGIVFSGTIFLYLLTMSCAQIGVPSGGEIDKTPPKIISISPELGATDVSIEAGGSIEVTFDEYVNVRGLSSQLLISPPFSKPIEWSIRKKTITFTWPEPLIKDVTYVFQFGDAVIDLHEGNSTDDFIHAFSTGKNLDTLSLSGTVMDAFSGSAITGVRIFLFDSEVLVDSITKGINPKFIGTTNEQGLFTIRYLPEGNYRVMAVDDTDRNYHWTDGESLAIYEEIIEVKGQDSLKSVMRMQETSSSLVKYFINASRDSLGLIEIEMSQKFDSNDSLYIGNLDSYSEGVNMWVWGNSIDDESIVWRGKDTLKVSEIRVVETTNLEVINGPKGKILTDNNVEIKFTRPIEEVADSLFVITRMDSTELEIDSVWIKENDPFSLEIEAKYKRGEGYELNILPGAVLGQGGQELLDSASFKWSTFERNELGEIEVIINRGGWLELISANGEVVKEMELSEGQKAIFKNLTPGTYAIKWKGDSNSNGSWDPVSLSKWKSPEAAEIMKTKVKVKADWSHQIKWLD